MYQKYQNRAPIWRTIKQLKPTRHMTMKELYTLEVHRCAYTTYGHHWFLPNPRPDGNSRHLVVHVRACIGRKTKIAYK